MVRLRHKSGKLGTVEPWQEEAYDWLMARERAALFLEMSLGKTIVALLYLHYMHYEDCAILKSLVVAPPNVVTLTWPNELADWDNFKGMRVSYVVGTPKQRIKALEADAEIYIISNTNLTWLCDYYITEPRKYKYVGTLPFDLVLIDEIDEMKNRGSVVYTKFERALRISKTRYRIGMTGTPIANGYVDLWAQMMLIDGGASLGDKFGAFCDKYFKVRYNGHIPVEYKLLAGAKEAIAHRIKDVALTMKTREHLELPDIEEVDEVLEFAGFDQDTYDELERDYCLELFSYEDATKAQREEMQYVTVKTPADLTMKLLQLSGGAIYADHEDKTAAREWFELNTLKMDRLRELIAEHDGENILLIYQFQHEVDRILAEYPHARILQRKGLKETFKDWNAGRIPLMLMHPKSGSHGLNLQYGGRRIIWYTPTYNLRQLMQTIARIARRGAKLKFWVHFLLAKGTRDAKVRKSNHSKQSEQDFLFEETKQLRKKYGKLRK